ncbi:MAG: hypothetical protein JXR95_01905 [Deltaproteobacteria bacterium]|nr:hypothetical protein [Deltaproteobacteria bacterium]
MLSLTDFIFFFAFFLSQNVSFGVISNQEPDVHPLVPEAKYINTFKKQMVYLESDNDGKYSTDILIPAMVVRGDVVSDSGFKKNPDLETLKLAIGLTAATLLCVGAAILFLLGGEDNKITKMKPVDYTKLTGSGFKVFGF